MDRRAEEAISLNPSIQTGYVMKTADVINTATKNPFFHSLNRMSALDTQKIQQDAIKSGFSVGIKNANGISRAEKMFINPKFTDLSMVGDGTGNRATLGSTIKGMYLADIIFSGANNQTPTIVGTQFIPREIRDATQASAQNVAQNSAARIPKSGAAAGATAGAIGTGAQSEAPVKVDISVNSGAVVGTIGGSMGALPKLLDQKGKPTTEKDKTQRGPFGNSIRTGTLKIGEAELRQLILGATGFF